MAAPSDAPITHSSSKILRKVLSDFIWGKTFENNEYNCSVHIPFQSILPGLGAGKNGPIEIWRMGIYFPSSRKSWWGSNGRMRNKKEIFKGQFLSYGVVHHTRFPRFFSPSLLQLVRFNLGLPAVFLLSRYKDVGMFCGAVRETIYPRVVHLWRELMSKLFNYVLDPTMQPSLLLSRLQRSKEIFFFLKRRRETWTTVKHCNHSGSLLLGPPKKYKYGKPMLT